jgi:hypothetical protein
MVGNGNWRALPGWRKPQLGVLPCPACRRWGGDTRTGCGSRRRLFVRCEGDAIPEPTGASTAIIGTKGRCAPMPAPGLRRVRVPQAIWGYVVLQTVGARLPENRATTGYEWDQPAYCNGAERRRRDGGDLTETSARSGRLSGAQQAGSYLPPSIDRCETARQELCRETPSRYCPVPPDS